VGKSTLAEGIAAKLLLPLFSVDPIESAILKSGIIKSFETGLAAYLVTERLAAEQLRLGMSVIIDAVSPVKESRDMWQNLSSIYNVRLVIIECVLDSELHRKRVEARVRNMHGIPEVTWEDVQHRRKGYLPWQEERLIINTADRQEEVLNKALSYINTANEEEI